MKHILNIPLCLILILLMGISGNCAFAQQDVLTDIITDNSDSEREYHEFDPLQDANVYRDNSPLGVRYTKKHPLIIVGNWNFRPYCFYNDHGEPDGFHVDILKQIFASMHIPYRIELMDWKKAKRMVCDGRAQLMVGIDKNDVTANTKYGNSVIAEYNIGVMRLKETPKIRSILLLTEKDTIYVMHGDYVDVYLKQYFGDTPPFHIEHVNSDDALQKVLDGTIKYFVWGVQPLKLLIKKYGAEGNLALDNIDIPSGNMQFFSNDKLLLSELDRQFLHIKAMQSYDPICEKWLVHGGPEVTTTTPMQITFIVFAVIFLVVLIIAIIIIHRSGSAIDLRKEFSTITDTAIDMTQCYVICFDIKKMRVNNVSGHMLPDGGISMPEYWSIIHPDDIQKEYEVRKQVDGGKKDMPMITLRMHVEGTAADDWRTMHVSAHIRSARNGNPRRVYLVLADETEHIAEQVKLDTALREFADITEITELGMAFYDANGKFFSCNHSIIDIFDKGGLRRAERYLHNTSLHDIPVILNGIVLEHDMSMWFCGPLDVPGLNLHITVEARIRSVYYDDGALMGYEICVTDIGEKRDVFRNERTVRARMARAKKMLIRSHTELRFILRHNKITTFRWQKGNDFFELSHDLLSFDKRMPLKQSICDILAYDKTTFIDCLDNPVAYFSQPHQDILCYRKHGGASGNVWLQIFTMPDYDSKGNFIGAFGIQCDITEIQQTQENLRRETERAENSGKQKTAFLANMTHELRTPLNAINGFAQILMYVGSAEEKKQYIDVMRHNSTMLINLVDNILQLSIMDTDGIKLHPRTVDFAQLFPAAVSEMKKYITSPDVKLRIDTPYATLPIEMDYERVIQVVDAFVNNAAKFTKKGFIRVGYRHAGNFFTIYCRDTGCGIPEDKQKAVFERFVKLDDFVQGTGLGLSVSKMIADRMGATIELYSKEGVGTTLSFNLPCAN